MELLYDHIEVVLESILQSLPDFDESTGVDATRPVTSFYLHYPLLQLCELITDKLFIR